MTDPKSNSNPVLLRNGTTLLLGRASILPGSAVLSSRFSSNSPRYVPRGTSAYAASGSAVGYGSPVYAREIIFHFLFHFFFSNLRLFDFKISGTEFPVACKIIFQKIGPNNKWRPFKYSYF
jgi:hypothetical protein